MSQIKSKDTKCECTFRSYIWSKGIRGYRTHARVTGRPDLYFPAKKLAVFIDGCFWHKCPSCFIKPENNRKFWSKKIADNVKRDKKVNLLLKKNGISVLRFWEHELNTRLPSSFMKLKRTLDKLDSEN